MNKKIVSVILARGGSKGIPRKNIINLGNKPLINWTINSSLKSNVSETWVSTEDKEIAKVAKDAGAKILNRPSNLATDISSSEDSLLHFAKNVDFNILVFIQPTSPLLNYNDINKGLLMMKNYDSVFSVYEEHWVPKWTRDSKTYNFNKSYLPRRQDKESLYIENGAFYITTKENLLKSKLRYSGTIGMMEMPLWRSFQVDTLDDLTLINKLI